MSSANYLIPIFLSILALNVADEEPVTNLECIVGRYKMSDFARFDLLKNNVKEFAEFIGTKPEHIQQIIEHPTVGNFEVKLISKDTQEIELTMETLTGKVAGRMKPGSKGEMAWLDGRKFSVVNMTRFKNTFENFKYVHMMSEIGGYSFSTLLELGKNEEFMWDNGFTDSNKNYHGLYLYYHAQES